MPLKILFAPLQGYTDNAYRRLHHQLYGAVDCYFTPFIRVEKGAPRRQDIARLEAARNDGYNLVPQIIFNSLEEFDILSAAVKELGYNHIDINLGCPYPMQTKKGRGAALIGNVELMQSIAKRIKDDADCRYSIKMRLGLKDPEEWKLLMPVLNDVKLEYITVHPRVATQMYGGELYTDRFAEFVKQSNNPVIYNGDILTIKDIAQCVENYPGIAGVMIGRGLLARPSLAAEWRDGSEWGREERLDRLMQLHDMLFDEYRQTLCGEAQILQKIKPFWDYLEGEIDRKTCKQLRKATTVNKYLGALP